jgi:hypothetical protein
VGAAVERRNLKNEADEVGRALDEVLGGDPTGMVRVPTLEPAVLREIALVGGGPLIVSRNAAFAVLTGLRAGSISLEQAQAWASFMSAGFVANRV